MLFIKYLLGVIFICSLLTQISYLTDVLFVIWGITMLMGALKLSRNETIALYAASIAVIITGLGFQAANYYVSMSIAVLVMGMLIVWRKDYTAIRGGGIIAAILGITFYIGSLYYFNGSIGIEDYQTALAQSFQHYLPIYEQYGMLDQIMAQGISREVFQTELLNMSRQIALFLPSFYYIQAIFTVFFIVFTVSILNRREPDRRMERKPYLQEIMPWQLVWVVIIALSLWLWGRHEQPMAYLVGANMMVIMIPIAVFFGFSAISWRIKRINYKYRKIIAALLIIMGVFILPSAIIFLTLIGLFDALLDYRKFRSGKGEEA